MADLYGFETARSRAKINVGSLAGICFLAAMTLLNVTAALAHLFLFDSRVPAFTILLVKLVNAFFAATLIIAIFFHQSRFLSCLPRLVPGRLLVIIGVMLWIGVPALVALELEYIEMNYLRILAQYGLATFPAYVCFLCGCGRMLLAAEARA